MGFIHGEVSSLEPSSASAAGIEAMLAAVTVDSWPTSDLISSASRGASCVLAVQTHRSGRDGPDAKTQDGPFHLVTDVRLTDRDTLAGRLGGCSGAPSSDDALIRRAFERWGIDCADRIDGEGTFALWDASEKRLFCWRDAAGVRPLYYHYTQGRGIVISSDLRSLVAHPRIASTLDLRYVRTLLESRMAYRPASRTMVQGIRKLPAGHALELTSGGLRVWRYFRPVDLAPVRYRDDREYVEHLRTLLANTVASRIPPDEDHVGAHLSGGLDSSSLSVLAARELRSEQRLTGFSWAPPWSVVPEVEGDERRLAEAAAAFGSIPLRFTDLRPSHVIELNSRDRATLPIESMRSEFATSRDAASLGVRTMISGWGGDELIVNGGIGYFADLARRGRLVAIHREFRRRSGQHGGSVRGLWKSRVLIPFLSDRSLRGLGWDSGLDGAPLPAELRPEFAQCLGEVEPFDDLIDYRERPGVNRNQLVRLTGGALQYRMEAWAAQGAGLGITYTYPLLDRRIIEFALSIPQELYFRDGWKRWLYRTAMEGVLPDLVRWNPDKYDNAAYEALVRVAPNAASGLESRLRARATNPYVDVEHLIAQSAASRPGSLSRGTELPRGSADGSANWLAFVDLPPP
jgi:asparagine synthase (glutamine-hydrolysing)